MFECLITEIAGRAAAACHHLALTQSEEWGNVFENMLVKTNL